MKIGEFVGLDAKMQQLMRSAQAGRIVHALLFTGPHGTGKKTMAELFAQTVLCTGDGERPCGVCSACKKCETGAHLDIHRVAPEKNIIKVDQIRDLIDTLSLTAREGGYKIAIIDRADCMNESAQNALLKTLENPPGDVLFFLLTDTPAALLNTIVSRCLRVRFSCLSIEDCARVLVSKGVAPERAQLAAALAQGRGEDMLPPAVWGYICRERLYGTHTDLKHLTPDELRPVALSYLKPKRMPHVLGTEQEAVRLAERYGADVTKARVAALLHDCTKKLDMAEQLALCERYRIPLDELERKALKLLHSKTGAAIARDVFAVDDEVYNAILYHTTGKPDMTLLEKIIYLADYIEPTRDFPGVEELRRTVYEDLDRGLLLGLTMTIQEMEELGNPVHHMTRDARDYLMKRGIS